MTPDAPTPDPSPAPTPCCGGGNGGTPEPEKTTRRQLMLKIGIGLNVVAGAMIGIPVLGYVFSSFVREMPLSWIPLGTLDKFPVNTTRLATYKNPKSRTWDGETAQLPCWVRHFTENNQSKFQVFAINCAHLGCPVRWFEESKLFLCPCHGGAYYQDGSYAAGPPAARALRIRIQSRIRQLYVKAASSRPSRTPTSEVPPTLHSTNHHSPVTNHEPA